MRYLYTKANRLRLGTVASGVGAPEVAAAGLRYDSVFVSEIEYFPCMVLHERMGASRPVYPIDPSIFGDDAKQWEANNRKLRKIPAKGLVPNFGDLTQLNRNWNKHAKKCAPNVLVGGTPCQAFSISGQRGGLDDHRGNLTLEYADLCKKSGAEWFVWENVYGALSSAGGDDFGAILACFAGYPAGFIWKPRGGKWKNSGVVEPATKGDFGLAWCVLDSQYFGVAQRRERLFIVGYRGNAAPAIAVLLDTIGLSGDSKPCRKAGKNPSGKLGGNIGIEDNQSAVTYSIKTDQTGANGSNVITERSPTLASQGAIPAVAFNHQASVSQSMSVDGICPALDTSKTPAVCYGFKAGQGAKAGSLGLQLEVSPTLCAVQSGSNMVPTIYYGVDSSCNANHELQNALMAQGNGQVGHGVVASFQDSQSETRVGSIMGTLDANYGPRRRHGVSTETDIRRLTPKETERLQGFPDNWTLVDSLRKKPNLKALAKYAANGNRSLDEEIQACAAYNGMTVEDYLLRGEAPDAPRYKAMGNSMTTYVLRWILGRIWRVNWMLKARLISKDV